MVIESVTLRAPAIAYSPRNYNPDTDKDELQEEQIASDLQLLRSSGFRSLVTYGSQGVLGSIPRLARRHGFDGLVVMGIWNPSSQEEWANALEAVPFVDGYCVGNEGLGIRYQAPELAEKMADLRLATGKPVTTSERIDHYYQGPYWEWLLKESDWLFPIAHPIWYGQFDPENAVNWTVVRYEYLAATSGRQIILKESGYPSAGSVQANEKRQLAFFQNLSNSLVPFFYFEAFDQSWKREIPRDGEIEGSWGLFDHYGRPKEVAHWIRANWSSE